MRYPTVLSHPIASAPQSEALPGFLLTRGRVCGWVSANTACLGPGGVSRRSDGCGVPAVFISDAQPLWHRLPSRDFYWEHASTPSSWCHALTLTACSQTVATLVLAALTSHCRSQFVCPTSAMSGPRWSRVVFSRWSPVAAGPLDAVAKHATPTRRVGP